jgi:hypothetical protein
MDELNRDLPAFNNYPVKKLIFSFYSKGGTGYIFLCLYARKLIIEFQKMPEQTTAQRYTEIRKSF